MFDTRFDRYTVQISQVEKIYSVGTVSTREKNSYNLLE